MKDKEQVLIPGISEFEFVKDPWVFVQVTSQSVSPLQNKER